MDTISMAICLVWVSPENVIPHNYKRSRCRCRLMNFGRKKISSDPFYFHYATHKDMEIKWLHSEPKSGGVTSAAAAAAPSQLRLAAWEL